MARSLSTQQSTERLAQARARFHSTGTSVISWARENGYKPSIVYEVLNGRMKCLRGMSHRIAVQLGIKDGVI